MESAINISLKDHLEKNKATLTWHNLMSITKQIARGMCYLEQQRCILRSLAGKYIVVTGASAVKISNFSIACFSPSGTFSCQSKFTILVRWAAPELMFDGLCSTKSDVWSFGVTFWEILTYGAKPYEGFGSGSVKEMVKSGYRMPLSELHLPQQIHSIMTDCWRKLPQDRPSFKNLLDRLIVIQDGINTPVQI
jgi:serine/threonine protein kinase